jgi:hypothetical protein
MTNTRVYKVETIVDNGEAAPSLYTPNPYQAQEEFLAMVSLNVESVHIIDANTGEVYAYFNCSRNGWGVEIDRGVANEFTEILAGLRV